MVEKNEDAAGRREAATRRRVYKAPHYVIHAPRYTSEWGGVMALYGLANALNAIGADAYVWPADVRFEAPVGRLEHLKLWMDGRLLSLHRLLRPARRLLHAVR